MRPLALLLVLVPLAAGAEPPRSGYQDASPETRAMQDDDDANPGFLWVKQGEAQWSEAAGAKGQSCAGCHGAVSGMKGVAARYPAPDPGSDPASHAASQATSQAASHLAPDRAPQPASHPAPGSASDRAFRPAKAQVVTLEQRINRCRVENMGAPPLAWDDDRLLGLAALVGLQSRGMSLAVQPVEPAYSLGASLFRQRMGQLNLSCAQCHDDRAGLRLGGALISQGHPNGYPLYRLEWQGMGSLWRRLRNCMIGVRAEPFPPDSVEATALALFLAVRATGLRVETPAVRP